MGNPADGRRWVSGQRSEAYLPPALQNPHKKAGHLGFANAQTAMKTPETYFLTRVGS